MRNCRKSSRAALRSRRALPRPIASLPQKPQPSVTHTRTPRAPTGPSARTSARLISRPAPPRVRAMAASPTYRRLNLATREGPAKYWGDVNDKEEPHGEVI